MRRIIFALVLCFSFAILPNAFAQNDEITIMINGKKIESEIAPQIVNDRTMLPMRVIFEEMGAEVTWIPENQLIFATKGESLIVMQINTPKMSVQKISSNENLAIALDSAPYIYQDRTMVPVRAIAEALEASVDWNGETRTVTITK